MWTLRKTTGTSEDKYFLPCNKSTVIGRKDVNIVITGDSSVSRKHSILKIHHDASNLKNPVLLPSVTIMDTSKFGTFILKPGCEKIKVSGQTDLNSGDIIQFGAQSSLYELQYEPFVVLVSVPDNEALRLKLEKAMLQLGGHLINIWHSKVTHVLVEKIKLSVKITQALVNCCHIITSDFVFKFEELLETFTDNVIEPEKFLPEVGEPNLSKELCCFKVNKKRKSVFNNTLFIFMCKKQLKRLGPSVHGGGGSTSVLSGDDINKTFITRQEGIFVDYKPNSKDSVISNSQYKLIHETLIKHQRRFVQEHEIGLAILYCDASVYCNSSFDLNSQNAVTQCHGIPKPPCPNITTSDKSVTKDLSSKVPGNDIVVNEVWEKKSLNKNATCEQRNLENSLSANTFADPKSPSISKLSDSPETITDSCLDDNSLWSQNSESFVENKYNFGMQRTSVREKRPLDKSVQKRDIKQSTSHIGVEPNTKDNVCSQVKVELPSFLPADQSPPKRAKKNNNDEAYYLNKTSTSYLKQQQNLESLPTNLAIIDIKSLVVKSRTNNAGLSFNNVNIKNFKLFRKVWPQYMGVSSSESLMTPSHVPYIVGNSDLFVNVNECDQESVIGKWL